MDINAKLNEENEKINDICLNISQNFAATLDHRIDLIKAHN